MIVFEGVRADVLDNTLQATINGVVVSGDLYGCRQTWMQERHVAGTNLALDQQLLLQRHDLEDIFPWLDNPADGVDPHVFYRTAHRCSDRGAINNIRSTDQVFIGLAQLHFHSAQLGVGVCTKLVGALDDLRLDVIGLTPHTQQLDLRHQAFGCQRFCHADLAQGQGMAALQRGHAFVQRSLARIERLGFLGHDAWVLLDPVIEIQRSLIRLSA